jgi:hypothetical protein
MTDRINIKTYQTIVPEPFSPETTRFEYFWRNQLDEDNRKDLESLYDGEDLYNTFEKSAWIIVYDGDKAIAFTKFLVYPDRSTSELTYSPNIEIANELLFYEIMIMSQIMWEEQYHELADTYQPLFDKTKIPGFEKVDI